MLTTDFILAGNAIFTVSSDMIKGSHYTYRVRLVHFEDDDRDWYFADLLTGPDNTRNYTYLGRVDASSGEFLRTSKSPAPGVGSATLAAVLRVIWEGGSLGGAEVKHAGKCGRCGRLLTDPESLERGIGPVCWQSRASHGEMRS